MSPKYEIITVDWNPEQTKIWLFHVKRNCPEAAVTLVPNSKPIPWNWSSGKLECFNRSEYKSNKVIYMDTDTIVTQDLGFVFGLMSRKGAAIGASSKIPLRPIKTKLFRHWSTGFLPFFVDELDPNNLYEKWKQAFDDPIMAKWKRSRMFEEACFGYALAWNDVPVWDIPLEIHGNICGKCYFGQVKKPVVIHYHRPERLKKENMGEYLNV